MSRPWLFAPLVASILASCSLGSLDELKGGVANARVGNGSDASGGSGGSSGSGSSGSSGGPGASNGGSGGSGGFGGGSGFGGASGSSSDAGACTPKTCAALGAECGTTLDGCGDSIYCGSCGANEVCDDGECECVKKSCAAEGWYCGTHPDGCGGTLDCGACQGNGTCVGDSCQLAAGNICGYCPPGFDAKYTIYNGICGSYCGPQTICVRSGLADSSGCGTSCPYGMHAAVLADACGCAGGKFVVCVPN